LLPRRRHLGTVYDSRLSPPCRFFNRCRLFPQLVRLSTGVLVVSCHLCEVAVGWMVFGTERNCFLFSALQRRISARWAEYLALCPGGFGCVRDAGDDDSRFFILLSADRKGLRSWFFQPLFITSVVGYNVNPCSRRTSRLSRVTVSWPSFAAADLALPAEAVTMIAGFHFFQAGSAPELVWVRFGKKRLPGKPRTSSASFDTSLARWCERWTAEGGEVVEISRQLFFLGE